MKIEEMWINGFGHFADMQIQMEKPMVVMYGPNEAGKSTWMSFVRYMLFGFPTRRHALPRYEPLRGGRYGGSMTLVDREGRRWKLVRYEGKQGVAVTDEDGATLDPGRWNDYLGGLTSETYRRLFAVSLSELQQFSELDVGEIGTFLYEAGLGTGGGKQIVQAEQSMQQAMQAWFKGRGQIQEIPVLLKQMETLERRLNEVAQEAGLTSRWQEQLKRMEMEISRSQGRIMRARQEIEWAEICIKAYPGWLRRQSLIDRLNELPDFTHFPERALERFERLSERERESLALLDKLHASASSKKEEACAHPVNEDLLALEHEADALAEQLPSIRENEHRLRECELDIRQLETEMTAMLADISPVWDADRLMQCPTSAAEKDDADGFRRQLAREARLLEQREAEYSLAEEQRFAAGRRLRELEQSHAGQEAAIRQIAPDLKQLPLPFHTHSVPFFAEYARWEETGRQVRHLRDRIADLAQMAGDADAVRDKGNGYTSGLLWLSVASGFFMIVSVGLFVAGWAIPANGALLVGALTAMAAWGGRLAGKKHKEQQSASVRIRAALDARLAELESALERANEDRQGAVRACLRHMEPWAKDEVAASSTGVTSEGMSQSFTGTTASELDPERIIGQWNDALVSIEPLARQLDLLNEQVREARAHLNASTDQVRQADKRVQDAQNAHAQTVSAWRTWLLSRCLPESLSPETMLLLFPVIESAKERYSRLVKLQATRGLLRDREHAFRVEAATFLQDAGKGNERALRNEHVSGNEHVPDHEYICGTSEELALQVKKVREEIMGMRKAKVYRDQCLEQWRQLVQDQDAAQLALGRWQQQIADLWREASAADEQQFHAHAACHAERLSLQKELADEEWRLSAMLAGKPLQVLADAYAEPNAARWEARREQWLQHLADNQREQDQWLEQKGRIREQLERRMTDEEQAELQQSWNEKQAELQQLVSQWSVHAMALDWFQRARAIYEREKQPAVLKRASQYFSDMTNHVYSRVISPITGGGLVVERSNGGMLKPAELSRGTAEQLFLSIRLALAGEMADRVPLPLLFDDVFVNFDKIRLAAAARVLVKMSEAHQVICFTCHDHVRSMLQQTFPSLQVIEL